MSDRQTKHTLPRRLFLRTLSAILPAGVTALAYGGEAGLPAKTIVNPQDIDRIAEILRDPNPHIWVFTGDSITHGAKHTAGRRSYPEIFEERLRWELTRTRDWVINTGISSQTTASILQDFHWRVSRFEPSVVSIMIGTNDCSKPEITSAVFEKNLVSLIGQIRALKAVPVLHTPNPIILNLSPERKTLPDYVSVIRQVAGSSQVLLVDNHEYWEKRQSKFLNDIYRQWLNDRLHPNYVGHQQIARLLFKTLNIFDPEAPACGGEYFEGQH
ncbi:SGNH/GDSL hydrolase family protein [Dyadobacter aurulentus]|uniref:SGNH/GDSL hydrolase family protein n=1 Tax=Dyadobacter sp. UC 10 TaxID=2605428 RepID=UPI0011F0C639|nr:SGNH/GDSL hydrolase family protein [Dyadobacter sp. UC 10]KAA0988821.1 SGNH/GDSL hydrolase family protein [Dyadobacter sp. UC 10]